MSSSDTKIVVWVIVGIGIAALFFLIVIAVGVGWFMTRAPSPVAASGPVAVAYPTNATPAPLPAQAVRSPVTTQAGEIWVVHGSAHAPAQRTNADGAEVVELVYETTRGTRHDITVNVYPNRAPFTAGTNPRDEDPSASLAAGEREEESVPLPDGYVFCRRTPQTVTCETARVSGDYFIQALTAVPVEEWTDERNDVIDLMMAQGQPTQATITPEAPPQSNTSP